MEKEEIHLSDIKRILLGEAPFTFLAEVAIRTLIIYTLCLLFIKWFGKRMSGQISITEMIVMLLIGSIISVPVQFSDRGILQGLFLLLALLAMYNGINLLGMKKKELEYLIQGKPIILVKDGVIELNQMKSAHISNQQLFATLRSNRIYNLGEVQRVYLEACGKFSIYKNDPIKAGLPIFPPDDSSVLKTDLKKEAGLVACVNCGSTHAMRDYDFSCRKCQQKTYVEAGLTKQSDE
jgi:uncharacterized membrane protein YcaP (DUF421 family)